MSKTISLIQRVQIASPCTASWDEMVGDDKSRFCSLCKLNVYNLSEMTERDAEKLIIEKEGKLCARIYRRRDGTVITRDCPLGWKAIRRKTLRLCVQTAAALLAIAAATAYAIGPMPKRHGSSFEYDTDQGIWIHRQFVEVPTDDGMFRQTASKLQHWLTDRYVGVPLGGIVAPPPPPAKQK